MNEEGNKDDMDTYETPHEEVDSKSKKIRVIELSTDMAVTREVIEKRLRFAEVKSGLQPGQGLSLDDSAYEAMERLTGGSIGLCLELLKLTIERKMEPSTPLPVIITGRDIESLGFTREGLEGWWDNPLRGARVLHVRGPDEF